MIDECTQIVDTLKRQLDHLQSLRLDRDFMVRNMPSLDVRVLIAEGTSAFDTFRFNHDRLNDFMKSSLLLAVNGIIADQEGMVKATQERLNLAMGKLFETKE